MKIQKICKNINKGCPNPYFEVDLSASNNRQYCDFCQKNREKKYYKYEKIDRTKGLVKICANPECQKEFMVPGEKRGIGQTLYCDECKTNGAYKRIVSERKEKGEKQSKKNKQQATEEIEKDLDLKFGKKYQELLKNRKPKHYICKYCREERKVPKERAGKGSLPVFCLDKTCKTKYKTKLKAKENEISRTKLCKYCGKPFIDTSSQNCMQYHPECLKKKNLKKPFPNIKCDFCGEIIENPQAGQKYCGYPKNCDKKRRKEAQAQNQQQFCLICKKELSKNLIQKKKLNHPECLGSYLSKEKIKRGSQYSQIKIGNLSKEDYFEELSSLPSFSETWWGRIGEFIFKQLYPAAIDLVSISYKSNSDFYEPSLGLIDSKICVCNNEGNWGSIKKGDRSQRKLEEADSTYYFVVNLNRIRNFIERIYLIPSAEILGRGIHLNQNSDKYKEYELSESFIEKANEQYKWILNSLEITEEDLIEERITRTRGLHCEYLFKKLYPQATHRLKTEGRAHTYDFDHPKYGRVDVKIANYKNQRYHFGNLAKDSSKYDYVFAFQLIKDKIEKIFLIPVSSFNTALKKEEISSFEITKNYNIKELNKTLAKIKENEGKSVFMTRYSAAKQELGVLNLQDPDKIYPISAEYSQKQRGWRFKLPDLRNFDKIFCVGLRNGIKEKCWFFKKEELSTFSFVLSSDSYLKNQILEEKEEDLI